MKTFDPIHSPSDFGRLILAFLLVMVFYGDVKRRDIQTAGQPVRQVEAVEETSSTKTVVVVVEEKPTAPTNKPIKEKICEVFGDECENAWKIVSECENKSLDPSLVHKNSNGTVDVGLFQINSIHGYSEEYLKNIDNNIRVAYRIFKMGGWSQWACSWVIGVKPFYER